MLVQELAQAGACIWIAAGGHNSLIARIREQLTRHLEPESTAGTLDQSGLSGRGIHEALLAPMSRRKTARRGASFARVADHAPNPRLPRPRVQYLDKSYRSSS